MLWNMWSITRHKRSYGHPLHPDLTPGVLTCVLPLGTVSSGRESEVESVHLLLTIIQFFSACHLTGSEGVGKCNRNGLLLLRKCAEHDLLITNTVFKLPNRNKTSWMHPRSNHWHLIDYVIVQRTDRQDVRVTKTMCGADCWTDHRLVVSKLNLRIQPARRPQGKKAPKRLDVPKLNYDSMKQAFINDISNKLGAMNLCSEDLEEN